MRTHSMRQRTRYLLLIPLLALAIVSFVFVRAKQGQGALLIARQRQAQALTSDAVARVVRVAPDPVAKRPGLGATCSPLGRGIFRNPWNCVIHYSSGRVIRYRITIRSDGSYFSGQGVVTFRHRRYVEFGTIEGCCVSIP